VGRQCDKGTRAKRSGKWKENRKWGEWNESPLTSSGRRVAADVEHVTLLHVKLEEATGNLRDSRFELEVRDVLVVGQLEVLPSLGLLDLLTANGLVTSFCSSKVSRISRKPKVLRSPCMRLAWRRKSCTVLMPSIGPVMSLSFVFFRQRT
jgi:hypothetical protein